ncbi:hypothetical protein K402DRAFT_12559 [Aulographum hederae CBS 113979]|uniref:Uncharacterized protein n=1 Tax=Aulographum hederae CBS 113979 TaxID=1176131 RepID=A0A6G1H766_9PEZI|nr:hypothetical protein K402DRAFT_12559 [Aulographum hederae CBS 113979]
MLPTKSNYCICLAAYIVPTVLLPQSHRSNTQHSLILLHFDYRRYFMVATLAISQCYIVLTPSTYPIFQSCFFLLAISERTSVFRFSLNTAPHPSLSLITKQSSWAAPTDGYHDVCSMRYSWGWGTVLEQSSKWNWDLETRNGIRDLGFEIGI